MVAIWHTQVLSPRLASKYSCTSSRGNGGTQPSGQLIRDETSPHRPRTRRTNGRDKPHLSAPAPRARPVTGAPQARRIAPYASFRPFLCGFADGRPVCCFCPSHATCAYPPFFSYLFDAIDVPTLFHIYFTYWVLLNSTLTWSYYGWENGRLCLFSLHKRAVATKLLVAGRCPNKRTRRPGWWPMVLGASRI
jgi:hypothetical protein